MPTQPFQRGTDLFAIIKGIRVNVNIWIPTFGVRAGINSDGVLVGAFTPVAVGSCFTSFGATPTLTNQTTAANNATVNDITLMAASPAVNDAVYVGHLTNKFSALKVKYSTVSSLSGTTMLWEYWNGSAWVNLATSNFLLDSTVSTEPWAATAGTYFITFVPPTNWALNTLSNGTAPVTGWFIRQRLTVVGTVTTKPIADQFWLYTSGLATNGSGLGLPLNSNSSNQLTAITFNVRTTLSATNNDTKLLLVNVSSGGSYLFTATKGLIVTQDFDPSLIFSGNDQLVVQQIQQDGTTEFAGVNLSVLVQPLI